MALSNAKAWFTRKYKTSRNAEWEYDDESQGAQIFYSGTYPDGYYQALRETNPFGSGFTRMWSSSFGSYACYASYKPGQIFLPKKYYTIEDFFPGNEIVMVQGLVDKLYESDVNEIKFAWKSPRGAVFWQNDAGMNIIPIIGIIMYKPDSTLPKRRYVSLHLHLMYTNLEPWQIHCNLDGSMFKLDDDGNEVKLVYGTDYTGFTLGSPGICNGYTSSGTTNPTKSETFTRVNYFINQLKSAKFYILFSNNSSSLSDTTKDNIGYFRSNVSVSISYRNLFGLLVDVSKVPGFPSQGFYIPSQNLFSDFFSSIDRSDGGPEPITPGVEDDPYEDDDDDGDEGGDGDFDDTDDPINPPVIPSISATGVGLVRVFNPTSGQLQSLAGKLWSPDFLEIVQQYFTSPLESVLGLSIVPVKPSTSTNSSIYLGLYDTQVSAPVVDSDYVIINCGEIPINRYWGSYLDYDPYTKISCYLPYIGEIDINPDQVMQKSLGVLYYVNVITGDTVAILTADGKVFATAAGNCVRQLPLSQKDYSAIINTAVTAVGAAILTAATAGAGSAAVAGAGAGVAKAAVKEAAVNSASARAASANVASGAALLSTTTGGKGHYTHAGQIGTGSGQLAPQKPFLTIERPNLDLASNYKSFVGYPCNKTMAIGACVGFTQIEATRLSIPGATDEEVAEILSILVEGVIV